MQKGTVYRTKTEQCCHLQVLDFVSERQAKCGEEAEPGTDAADLRLLWGMLRLLVQNKGSLRSPPEQPGKGKAQATASAGEPTKPLPLDKGPPKM